MGQKWGPEISSTPGDSDAGLPGGNALLEKLSFQFAFFCWKQLQASFVKVDTVRSGINVTQLLRGSCQLPGHGVFCKFP